MMKIIASIAGGGLATASFVILPIVIFQQALKRRGTVFKIPKLLIIIILLSSILVYAISEKLASIIGSVSIGLFVIGFFFYLASIIKQHIAKGKTQDRASEDDNILPNGP